MDTIFVRDLLLRGKHGVHEHERRSEQEFLIDIQVQLNTRKAAASDLLEDTANYSLFRDIARDAVERNSFYLIEKLAGTIAQKILEDTRIARVEVTIRKLGGLKNGIPGVTVVRRNL